MYRLGEEGKGIPQVDSHAPFQHMLVDNGKELHCLVMEKIEGQNLQKWLEENGNKPLTEKVAIDWLIQLIEILKELHENDYMHLDLKPDNIMLRNGKLVLIDFGGVIERTPIYYAKLGAGGIETVGTPYYSPPEQTEKKPCQQSDFLALGRTFVRLITGKELSFFTEDKETKKLLWRQSAWHISRRFSALLDKMMEPSVGDRSKDAESICEWLKKLRSLNRLPSWLREDRWQFVVTASALATTIVMGIRLTGILQTWELGADDAMMRSRPKEPIDPRILVVEVTQE